MTASTSTWSRPIGWHSGISSPVRLAARTPAMRAVPSTSPLGASPSATTRAVAGDMRTTARATARRWVTGLSPTSTMRASPCSSRCVRPASGIAAALGRGRRGVPVAGPRDHVEDGGLVAGAQQRDRVRVAVDDRLEELLAVLIGGQRGLGPAADVVEQDRQARVLLAELRGDLALHALGQRGGRAGGRDRDRQRTGAQDRRQDEVAQRRHVDDVDEHRAALGVLVDADVGGGVVGAGDHHEDALEVGGAGVVALLPADRALARQLLELGADLGRDDRDVAVAGQQALGLLQPQGAAADHEAPAPAQLQAGDVEGRVQHVAHAGLVADPALELADALLPFIGGGRHLRQGRRPYCGSEITVTDATSSYFTDDALLRRVHREKVVALSGPRALLMMGAHPVAFEGFFMATGSLDDPYLRLRRTADVMDAIAWGSRADADRKTRRVRAMHARARGVLPRAAGPFAAGTPWAADDPELLLWIVACLADSAVLVYERYVTDLTAAERDAYWRDYRVIGRLFGLEDADMPQTWADFTTYMNDMLRSGDLVVTPTARAVGIEVVLR